MCSKLEYFFELLYFVEFSTKIRLVKARSDKNKVCNIKCSYQVPKLIENKIMGTELPVVSVAFEMCTLKRCFV